MIADLGGVLLLNALLLAAGCGITAAAGWWRGAGIRDALGVSYLAGVAGFGVIAQLLYVAGASLSRVQVVAVCLVLACGAVRGARRGGRRERLRDPLALAAIPLAAFVVLVGIDLWFQPLWAYDSWTFWTPKAHALWALGGLDAGWFTQADLTSRDYPILLPSVEAAGFRFTGYETALLDVQSLLFFVGFLRTVYEVSVGRARSGVLWAVLAMLVVAPSVTDQLAAAEADVPVAVLFAAAGACGAVWLQEGRRSGLSIAAVLAAGAAATKVEGLAFTVALFVGLAAAGAARSGLRTAVAPLAAGTAAVVLGAVPWRIWLAVHHVPNQGSVGRVGDLGYLAHNLARVPLAAAYMAGRLLDPRSWLLVIPLFLVVIARSARGRRARAVLPLYAITTASLALLGLVLAYWSTRLGFRYQLTTSARRVVTGVVFFCAALTPLLSARS